MEGDEGGLWSGESQDTHSISSIPLPDDLNAIGKCNEATHTHKSGEGGGTRRRRGGALSGLLFTHHKPVYYIGV